MAPFKCGVPTIAAGIQQISDAQEHCGQFVASKPLAGACHGWPNWGWSNPACSNPPCSVPIPQAAPPHPSSGETAAKVCGCDPVDSNAARETTFPCLGSGTAALNASAAIASNKTSAKLRTNNMVRFSTGTIIIAEIAAFHNSRQTAMFPSHHQKSGSFPVMVNGGDAMPRG